MSMASKEAVPHALDTEFCSEVACILENDFVRFGELSMSSLCDWMRFKRCTNEMSCCIVLFVRFGARMKARRASSPTR